MGNRSPSPLPQALFPTAFPKSEGEAKWGRESIQGRGSMADGAVRPLSEYLAEVPDPRKARGKRHPLGPILCLACVGLLSGCDSVLAIAEWGRAQRGEVVARLGFTRRRTPCVATLHRVFRDLDAAAFERAVGRWAAAVLDALGARAALPPLAIDGKTVRGSRTDALPAQHLLSA